MMETPIESGASYCRTDSSQTLTGQYCLYLAAAAVDAAEAGQDFSNGQDLAGILSLFGPELTSFGDQPVDLSTYTPHMNDIAVIHPIPTSNRSGHVGVWDGNRWVSDYIQPDYNNNVTNSVGTYRSPVPGSPTGVWAGATYQIFRH